LSDVIVMWLAVFKTQVISEGDDIGFPQIQ